MRPSVCFSVGLVLAICACSPETGPVADANEAAVGEDHSGHHSGHHMAITKEEAEKKQTFADMLVDRFDAKQCLDAEVLATMRKTEADGRATVLRAYQAPIDCVSGLNAAFETLDFREIEPGLYAGGSADGTTERVLIDVADDGSGAVIEWEVDQK